MEPTKRNSSNTTKFNLVTEDFTVDLIESFWKVTKHTKAGFRFSRFNRTCLVNSVFACVDEWLGLKPNWFRTRVLWLLTPRVLHIKPSPSPLIVYKKEKLDGNYSHHSCPPSWISGLPWQFFRYPQRHRKTVSRCRELSTAQESTKILFFRRKLEIRSVPQDLFLSIWLVEPKWIHFGVVMYIREA